MIYYNATNPPSKIRLCTCSMGNRPISSTKPAKKPGACYTRSQPVEDLLLLRSGGGQFHSRHRPITTDARITTMHRGLVRSAYTQPGSSQTRACRICCSLCR